MSGLGRACAVMAARSLNGASPQVTGRIACSELVVRDKIELSTFRFSGRAFLSELSIRYT
jgi:hypothetical protein